MYRIAFGELIDVPQKEKNRILSGKISGRMFDFSRKYTQKILDTRLICFYQTQETDEFLQRRHFAGKSVDKGALWEITIDPFITHIYTINIACAKHRVIAPGERYNITHNVVELRYINKDTFVADCKILNDVIMANISRNFDLFEELGQV